MAGNWHRIGDIKGADGVGVPTGGARGDVLKKEGGTDYATSWGAVDYADITGKVPASALPEIGTAPYVVDSQAAMLNLPAVPGRQAIRTDIGATFVLAEEPASELDNWVEMVSRSDVTSVNDKTGSVVLTKADVGLSEVNNTADSDKPVATQSVRGLMSSDDKKKLDAATAVATNNAIVRRNDQGRSSFTQAQVSDQPRWTADVVPLGFLQTALEGKYGTGKVLGDTEDLNDLVDDEAYTQSLNANTSRDLNYPDERAGVLFVKSSPSAGIVWQIYITYHQSSTAIYWRTRYKNEWGDWKQVAEHELATSSRDGLMSSSDKALLDSAANGAVGNSLVVRNSSGRFNAADPTVDGQVANKGYVDREISRISGGEHTYADDFGALPTKTRTVIVEGAPYGSPHAVVDGVGFTYNGITEGQIWKVEEEILGLGYATQKWTLVGTADDFTYMLGFAWERTWIPGRSQWTGYTCVAGDTGDVVSRAYVAGSQNYEPGKPWRTRNYQGPSTPNNSTSVLYEHGSWPVLRREGGRVHLHGRFTAPSAHLRGLLDGSGGFFVMAWMTRTCMRFWLGAEAEEAASQTVQQGSYDNRWLARVVNARAEAGRYEIRAARYGPAASKDGVWLPLSMSWLAPVPVALTHENAADPDALPEPGEPEDDTDTGGDTPQE